MLYWWLTPPCLVKQLWFRVGLTSAIFELIPIESLPTILLMYPTMHHPRHIWYASGHPLLLAITFMGSKAFMQLAPINTPTSTSFCVISDEIVFRQSHSSILFDVATSFLSTCKCFLVQILGSFIHVLPCFDLATRNPSIAVVD